MKITCKDVIKLLKFPSKLSARKGTREAENTQPWSDVNLCADVVTSVSQ